MLFYSMILEINDSLTKDDFIKLIIEWNQNSPHDENRISGIKWSGERSVSYGTDGLWLESIEYRNYNTIAV